MVPATRARSNSLAFTVSDDALPIYHEERCKSLKGNDFLTGVSLSTSSKATVIVTAHNSSAPASDRVEG
jgi:hypothetical protein